MSEQKPNNYAFVDAQNLHLGIRSRGWALDYAKFRLYLKNKYGVSKALLFIGQVPDNEALYAHMKESGFELVFKPTIGYEENGRKTYKGNVDAELVLHSAAIEFKRYDKAVIVSGDGDFACLLTYLERTGKLLHVLAPNEKYSSLLKPFSNRIVSMQRLRKSIEATKKTGISGRSKP